MKQYPPIRIIPKGDSSAFSISFFQEGATVLINKPVDWTSFDAVNKIRSSLKYGLGIKKIKVGHAGTLDPLATGLLIICIGRNTKLINELTGMDKSYSGTMVMGATTPSYDLETDIDATYPIDHIDEPLIEAARQSFMGPIDQFPPMFSAIKKDGERLYKLARDGKKIELTARKVTIHDFALTNVNLPEIDFDVTCSKGTYIRSLAYDFGKKLGSGGYLKDLVRTAIGSYSLDSAWELNEFVEALG